MSEMMERVAKAIWPDAFEGDGPGWHQRRSVAMDQARAAITALREPTRKMLGAGGFYHIQGAGAVSDSDMEIANREWQAMIDEALR